jgi:hypothetical protein
MTRCGLALGRDIPGLTHCVDLLPTLMDLCRLQAPDGLQALQGVSLKRRLRGEAQDNLDRILVSQSTFLLPKKYQAAVMWKQWRGFCRPACRRRIGRSLSRWRFPGGGSISRAAS